MEEEGGEKNHLLDPQHKFLAILLPGPNLQPGNKAALRMADTVGTSPALCMADTQ